MVAIFLSSVMIVAGAIALLAPRIPLPTSSTAGGQPQSATSLARVVLFNGPGQPNPQALAVIATVGAATLLSVLVRTALPSLLGAGLLVLIYFSRKRRVVHRRNATLLDKWPEVLDDLRIRVGAFGEPLPQATFVSLQRLGPQLTAEITEAERIWTLTGSYHDALSHLDRAFSDLASSSVFDSLKLCSEIGGADLPRRLEELRQTRDADRVLLHEVQAKLGAVRLARAFVIIVPFAMALIGGLLSGSLQPFLTPLGLGIDSVSGLLILGCWVWSTALMKPPNQLIGAPRVKSSRPSLSAIERFVTKP